MVSSSKEMSLRWSAINAARQSEDTNQRKPVSEGLWNALPLFGGGQQPDYSDTASVKSGRSSTSSKYRDEEGERLLDMAAKRLNTSTTTRNEAVSLRTSTEAKEYGENNSSEDEDEETEFRRRVVLDKEGNLTYDDDGYGDLHSRRTHNYYRRSMKQSVICILAIGVCVGIMVTFGLLVTKRLIGRRSSKDATDSSHSHGASSEQRVDGGDEWYQKPPSERFHAIKARLLEIRVTHPASFEDIHSAQYAALKWIADDDPRQLDPSNAFLTQRYGLVVLWFSTTETEYEWHVPAEYSEASSNHTGHRRLDNNNGTSVWTKHRNWLTDKGICEWEGVTCHTSDDEDDVAINTDGDVSRIEMRNNNMHGLMCKEIFTTLPHLTYADMSNNGFTGILSSQIGLWSELTYLNFTANRLGGSIPREIGEISQLKVLHFADNLLGESIPHTVGDLNQLRDLDLSGNELKGTIPYEMGQLEGLISLNLERSQPRETINNSSASNLLMGQIPHEFSKLSVVTLDVGYNNLGGPIPTEIGLMSRLETLRLNDNHFSGAVPSEIGQLVHLNEMHMNNNDFVGVLPSQLSNLLGLGKIPIEWTKLTGLQRLDVSNNKLQGELPIMIYDMKNLRELNLAKNSFAGEIPTELGSLYKLEAIHLETNEFKGSIPSQLGDLSKLKKLMLHNNLLTGKVSPELCKLVNDMFLSLISADCAGEAALLSEFNNYDHPTPSVLETEMGGIDNREAEMGRKMLNNET
ncbi:hypothetical protein HJC23_003407 [Cyclotella cryptica]|uniref:Leucine-rich repeat-containing N-terminal plant-type domain-containing protein n=1 Tax=Cyclotella cryptica TaxID=29204 RepID=A0ABD3QS81_9STRA